MYANIAFANEKCTIISYFNTSPNLLREYLRLLQVEEE